MIESSGTKDEGRASIPAVITTVISLAGFAILFVTQSSQLPLLAQIAVTSIIIALGILFGVWIWSRPLRERYESWRRDRIAHANFGELVRLFERFYQFVDRGISQPQFFLYQLKQRQGNDFSSMSLPFNPYYSQMFASNLSIGLKGRKSNLASLIWFSDSFFSLITYYNETLLSTPVKEVLSIIKKVSETEIPPEVPQVPDDIRKGFNAARLKWVRFLQDFEVYSSRVSRELGQYRVKIDNNWVNFDYLSAHTFEPPEELPVPVEF